MGAFGLHIPNAMALALPQTECYDVSEAAVFPDIESLVREHARLVFRIAYSVIRNHADAEDVVQEVFLRVAKHGAKGIVDPKAWISRIAWRASVDRYRNLRRSEQEEFDERAHVSTFRTVTAEGECISRETLSQLDRMIAVLPSKERDALLLTSVQELTSAEAAAVLGTTETSVRARVFRARQRLAERLEKLTGASHGRKK
jgi:RNA polymerase sigma-70 factor (ECF subfamily)